MERVEVITSHGTKDRGGAAKYSSVQLCGQHTLEVCYLDCEVKSKSSASDSTASETKSVKSFCIVMVSDDDLQFVLVTKADQVDIVRAFVKGIKYSINFNKIADVTVLTGNDNEKAACTKAEKACPEPQPRSILIHLHCDSVCKIDTNGYGSTHVAKQIQSAWQSSLVRRSARLAKLYSTADASTAEEYLSETINTLKLNETNKNLTYKLSQKLEIFDEFASEVWTDLQLKYATCQSRELFVSTVLFCRQLITAPAQRSSALIAPEKMTNLRQSTSIYSNMSGSSQPLSTSRNLFNEKSQNGETIDVHMGLQAMALQRLVLIRSALKVIVATVFCSETASSRYGLLGGPIPLTLDSWCSLLTPDLYLEICYSLGCPPETDEQQVSMAMEQSLLFQSSSLPPTSNASRGRDSTPSSMSKYPAPGAGLHLPEDRNGTRSPAVSALWRRSAGDALSGSILTPVKERNRIKLEELEILVPTLHDTRRGICDLQLILMYELARIACIGYSAMSRDIVLSRNPHTPATPSYILFFGETYAQQPNWEASLEDILLRVSTLLDDLLCSAAVTSKMLDISLKKLRGRRKPNGRQRNRSLSGDSEVSRDPSGPRGRPSWKHEEGLWRSDSVAKVRDPSVKNISIADEGWKMESPLPRDSRAGALDDNGSPLRLAMPNSIRGLENSASDGPRTPNSSSFESGLLISALGTSRATVPPSPVPRPRSQSRERDRDRDRYREGSRTAPLLDSDDENERKKRSSRCPLETQEILLFYSLSLLHSMALDSAKIRKSLGQDLSSYWLPIMHIFNTICPRPTFSTGSQKSYATNTTHESSSAQRSSRSPVRNVPQEVRKEKSFFRRMFHLKSNVSDQLAAEAEEKQKDFAAVNGGKNTNARGSLIQQCDDEECLLVTDYGPAQYGMSEASWTLLVMARKAAEDLVLMLGLHGGPDEEDIGGRISVSVPFRLQEPTPMQIQGLDRQEEEERGVRRSTWSAGTETGSGGRKGVDLPRPRNKAAQGHQEWEGSDDGSDASPHSFSPQEGDPRPAPSRARTRNRAVRRAREALDSDLEGDSSIDSAIRKLPPKHLADSPKRSVSFPEQQAKAGASAYTRPRDRS